MSAHRDHLLALVNASWTTQTIGAALRLGVPAALADGARDLDTIAKRAGAHAPSLRRLLEALATLGLVGREDGDQWSLAGPGRLLLEDVEGSLAAWAEFCAGPSWNVWRSLADSVRTGACQRGDRGFSDFEDDAEAAAVFNRAMRDLTGPIATAFADRVDLDLSARVVDVGGGSGELLAAVLARHPMATGRVFDRPHAAAGAARCFNERGIGGRAVFVAGDFFESVPGDANVYLVKSVLHDWDDAKATGILRRIAAATSADARVFVLERLRPEPAGESTVDRAIARSDLNMLVGTGGRERSEAEYAKLLDSAGLRHVRTVELVPGYGAIEAHR